MKRRHRGHHWQLLDERIYKRPLLHRFSVAGSSFISNETRRRNVLSPCWTNPIGTLHVPRLPPILAICVCSRYGTNTRSDHRVDVPVETPLARQVGLIPSWLVRSCPSWIFFFQDTVAGTCAYSDSARDTLIIFDQPRIDWNSLKCNDRASCNIHRHLHSISILYLFSIFFPFFF